MLDRLKSIFVFGFISISVLVAGDDDDLGRGVGPDAARSCTSSASSDADAPARAGSSLALFLCVHEGDVEGLRAEVAAGADVNFMLGSIRRTPLHSVARLGFLQMARALLALGADPEIVDRLP